MPKAITPLPLKPNEVTPKPVPAGQVIHSITFFGDSSISEDHPAYKLVYDTAQILAKHGMSIVDGGGPGVMKAATDGAESVGGDTETIYWEPKLASIFEGKNLTNVGDRSNAYSSYMMRTLGLIERGHVYVVCLGGTGTVSEFGMVWALAKLYYGKHKPVILLGDFWPKLITTFQETMLIDDNELGVLHYANTPEDVLKLVQEFELEVQARARKTYEGDETAYVLAPRFDEKLAEYQQKQQGRHLERVPNLVSKAQLDQFAKYVQSPARVLDVGCGAGYDLAYLSEKYSVTAIDNDPEMIEMARFENPNADVLMMDIRDYELQTNVFKGIWARDVLHHLYDDERLPVFEKLARALVPGGVLQFIVREGDGEGEEKDVYAGKEITRYYNYFSVEEVNDIVNKVGLQIMELEQIQRSHNWLNVIVKKPE